MALIRLAVSLFALSLLGLAVSLSGTQSAADSFPVAVVTR